ncbi:glycosyltransferase [Natronomonas halophila]|uniref:glycosyltransferase n=1 Tax=Natronomonas halophila TaxID=2747817 RepID=UPI0015B628A2|nr:glycosyltransferase [Natronomonas halophila]QLD84627.1 glycosyltransferase [Natronomonas halophila]QLD84681.1 glycosyltransferase [Natronomonas halophila]
MSSDLSTPTLATPSLDGIEPRVAIVSPGDRTDRLTVPLAAAGIDYSVNPVDPTTFDVVICDTPDREMLRTVVECRLDGTPVLFRQRGDPFWGIGEWIDSRVKKAVLFRMLRAVDGCLAIAPHQASKYSRKTGVQSDIVTLPKDVAEWPDSDHTDEELRIISLTNATYPDKYRPLLELAPAVDEVLESGTWRIGSWCDKHGEEIRGVLGSYDNIEYGIQLDAEAELEWANVMIHHSGLDVLPNAILEGMAARLPVLTNPHVAFSQSPAPTVISSGDRVPELLAQLRDPEGRQVVGDRGHDYVARAHDPEAVGHELVRAVTRLTDIGGDGKR